MRSAVKRILTTRPRTHTSVVITKPGAGSQAVPVGYHTLIAETWGGGGGGSGGSDPQSDGAGGAGYSRAVLPVIPGQVIFYNVGSAGVGSTTLGTDGGASWVNPSANSQPAYSALNWSTMGALGPGGGGSNNGVGVGGVGSVGDVSYSGGAGGPANAGTGGGGGGSAGSKGNGATATNQFGAAGGTPDGGAGSDGIINSGGLSGTPPGGGGGGAFSTVAGLNGGVGKIKLTFVADAQYLSARTFDTSSFTVGGGELFDAKRVANGNLIVAVGRNATASKNGISEISLAGATLFSKNDAGWALSTSAQFTATRNALNQINVTAISSGFIGIGDQLVASAVIPANTTITGFVSGTNGGIGIYTTNNDTTASASSVTAKRPAGPESVHKYEDTGTYLYATVDGGSGNDLAEVAEIQANGTFVWKWNSSAAGTNRADPAILADGTQVVIIYGTGATFRRDVTVIKRSDQSTLKTFSSVASAGEINGGAYRAIGGVNYILALNWNDVTGYLLNYDTGSVVRSFAFGTLFSSPGSGWDAKWLSDDEVLIACGFNGAIARVSGMTAWVNSGTSPTLSWKSAIFSEDTVGAATPTTSINLLPGTQQEFLTVTRSILGAPGLVYQSAYGP
jgi:hypothetical protein